MLNNHHYYYELVRLISLLLLPRLCLRSVAIVLLMMNEWFFSGGVMSDMHFFETSSDGADVWNAFAADGNNSLHLYNNEYVIICAVTTQ